MTYRLVRRKYHADVRHVVWMQSCLRRRTARKQLKTLKQEARSVSKFKEISYRLENKVVELTQNLQLRTAEKKELQKRFNDLEHQLQNWMTKHEDAEGRSKKVQGELQAAQAELSRQEELLATKREVEHRLEEALKKTSEKDELIQKLSDDLQKQTLALEERQKQIETAAAAVVPVKTVEDGSVIATLKREVNGLREQLNRANALNSLNGRRAEPASPVFAPTLKPFENLVATQNGTTATPSKKHQRRHSTTGAFSADIKTARDSADELMLAVKRNQLNNPRAVSVAYNGLDMHPQMRRANGLSDIYDDPAEEKIKLLDDAYRMDEDVLQGLIRGLKIPAASLTNAPSPKEVLFPANLISLVTNEMWKYGLIAESERFLANVMQTVQSHVMVSRLQCASENASLIRASPSPAKTPSCQACTGCPTCTRFCRSSASRRATCYRASGRAATPPVASSNGPTTSVWCPSSSTTLTA